jgi:beta-N-acetylhexosaminidase
VAFLQGMAAAHIAATAKHFPGLGRVTKNPDTATHVVDATTTRSSPYLVPFADAIRAGIPLVMVSTVTYTKIDASHPAAFSRTVVTGMLRGDLGFGGVVISDDLGKARQVTAYSLGARALNFIRAGGDVVLTVLPSTLPAMYNAVLAEAKDDSTFRATVNQAALRVLTLKAKLGLIH